MDDVRRDVRDDAAPYGADTLRLRITWPTAPVSRGYNGRMWRMRPLRGWTGGQVAGGEPNAWVGQGGGAAIPIADRIPAASNGKGGTMPNAAPPPLDPNRLFVAAHPPVDLECEVRGMMRLDVTGMVGIQGWDDRAS